MILSRCIAIVLALFLASPSFAAPSAQEAALEYVTRQHLGDNLSRMAAGMAMQTNTFATLLVKLGADGAKASLSNELQASCPGIRTVGTGISPMHTPRTSQLKN